MVTKKPIIPPQPKGPPTRMFFYIGAIGALIMMIAASLIGAMFLGNFRTGFFHPNDEEIRMIFNYHGLFSAGMAVTALGFYGFYRNYSFRLGLITTIFLIISSVIFIALIIFAADFSHLHFLLPIEYFIALEIVGLSLIFMGVSLIKVRHYTMTHLLNLGCGIGFLAVSTLFFTLILAVHLGIAWFAMIPCCISLFLVFVFAQPLQRTQNTMLPSDQLHNEFLPQPESIPNYK